MSHQHRTTNRWGNTTQGVKRCIGTPVKYTFLHGEVILLLSVFPPPPPYHHHTFLSSQNFSSSISSLWCFLTDNPLGTHRSTHSISHPPIHLHHIVFFILLNVRSCLSPWWNPVFGQIVLFSCAKVLQFQSIPFWFLLSETSVWGHGWCWGFKVSQNEGHSYWESVERQGTAQGEDRKQLDKKSKTAFWKRGARATKQSTEKRKSMTFFSYLSIFSDIQYIFEGTWVNRNTGWRWGGKERLRKRYLSCERMERRAMLATRGRG